MLDETRGLPSHSMPETEAYVDPVEEIVYRTLAKQGITPKKYRDSKTLHATIVGIAPQESELIASTDHYFRISPPERQGLFRRRPSARDLAQEVKKALAAENPAIAAQISLQRVLLNKDRKHPKQAFVVTYPFPFQNGTPTKASEIFPTHSQNVTLAYPGGRRFYDVHPVVRLHYIISPEEQPKLPLFIFIHLPLRRSGKRS